jgi:hypothetical protein
MQPRSGSLFVDEDVIGSIVEFHNTDAFPKAEGSSGAATRSSIMQPRSGSLFVDEDVIGSIVEFHNTDAFPKAEGSSGAAM